MSSKNTVRVSLRLRKDVHDTVIAVANDAGIDPAAFMQTVIAKSVESRLPEATREELRRTEDFIQFAQKEARALFAEGGFTEHFTLSVFDRLMANHETRSLYEDIIGADALTDGAPGKTPLNMYLGWYIKNAVGAEPLLDEAGKAKRAFVKGKPIKSYTLLSPPAKA